MKWEKIMASTPATVDRRTEAKFDASAYALDITDIEKLYPSGDTHVRAVDGVSLRIRQGEFYTLLGPSGCGKSTTLRSVAGLEDITGGSIRIGGVTVAEPKSRINIPAHKRGLGMVFQNYAIWPHMTVAENLAVPLKANNRRISEAEIQRRTKKALEMVQLSGYEHRRSTKMSGGQQQRLALARAIIHEPTLLLLDEPLSNLDAKLRDRMREELVQIQREQGLTALYVTHDQAEALSMSDRIAVMNSGRMEQEGTPWEIYHQPTTRFVASFVGVANFLECEITERLSGQLARVAAPIGAFVVRYPEAAAAGGLVQASVMIRPEALRIASIDQHATMAPREGISVFDGIVESASFVGVHTELRIRIRDTVLVAHSEPLHSPVVGDTVKVEIPSDAGVVLAFDN